MSVPEWRDWIFDDVLTEPARHDDRIILWLPDGREGRIRYWERVATVARPAIIARDGLHSVAASTIRFRQAGRGPVGPILRLLKRRAADRAWTLPNGVRAEQCGARRADVMLVWADDPTNPPDEASIRTRWPEGRAVRKVGENLYLVEGIEPNRPNAESAPSSPQGLPRDLAERSLAAARHSGDRPEEVAALTDLGVIALREGDARGAVAHLEMALAVVRPLGDRSREGDVLGNLGLAVSAAGQARQAQALFEQELMLARDVGDRVAEKLALEHLGFTFMHMGDPANALACFERAWALAREVGDRQQEATLLWSLGILHAEGGRRDLAIARSQAAVDLLRSMGKPEAGVYAESLQEYRAGDTQAMVGGPSGAGMPLDAIYGGAIDTNSMAGRAVPGPVQGRMAPGPGLLRMALSAARSATKFVGSGLKTAGPEVQQARLQVCAGCEHHTGLRCRVCGCFTGAKSRLLHEVCPIGKWPA